MGYGHGQSGLGFGEILFATRSGPDAGNITNGSVRDLFGPGGDIYVKQGLLPSDPTTPLIQDRLGAGHIRGLDLGWDADRLVFSYQKLAEKNRILGRSWDSARREMSGNS